MLTWNVYVGKFNSQHIEIYNIFDHISFLGDWQQVERLMLEHLWNTDVTIYMK